MRWRRVSTRPRALVTDGQERWAVAVCRSLHRAGYRVTAAADCRPAVAHWSRHCRGRIYAPVPSLAPGAFAATLAAELERERYACVVVGGDASLLAVSHHRTLLEPHLEHGLGLPPAAAVEAAMDKAKLVAAGGAAGLPCPETIVCGSVAEAAGAAATFGYPVVVKPICSVYAVDGTVRRDGSRIALDAAQLTVAAAGFGERCLVQRAERGDVHSCSGVFAGGSMLAFSLARYDRTFPARAGNAALSETIEPPAALADQVGRLLDELGWHGIFELELLRLADGSFRSIDLNPRVYGSLALAAAAGADLPAVFAAWLRGEPPAPVVARPGLRYRWEDAELRRFIGAITRGRLSEAATVARPRRHVVHPHFRFDDPLPLAVRLGYLGARTLRRAAQRVQRASRPLASEPIEPASDPHSLLP